MDEKTMKEIRKYLIESMKKVQKDVDEAGIDHPFWDEAVAGAMADAALSVVVGVRAGVDFFKEIAM